MTSKTRTRKTWRSKTLHDVFRRTNPIPLLDTQPRRHVLGVAKPQANNSSLWYTLQTAEQNARLSYPPAPADSIYNRSGRSTRPCHPHPVTCMRYAVVCFLATLLGAAGVPSSPQTTVSSVTILFDFDGKFSQKSLQEMKRELASIMLGSGLQIDWRERSDVAPSESFA